MRLIIMLAMAIVSTGCARLTVQVDVLDPVAVGAVIEESNLWVLYYKIGRSSPETVNDEVEALRKKNRETNRALARLYRKLAEAIGDDGLKKILNDTAGVVETSTEPPDGPLYPLYEALRTALWLANQKMLVEGDHYPLQQNKPMPAQLRDALIERKNLERRLKQPILATLDAAKQDIRIHAANLSESDEEKFTDKANVAAAPMEKALTTVVGGPTLVGSEFAYPVASAPDEDWATKFNHAAGSGFMGDSDIVIKMNSQGDFTVKGMQFDPSTVAAVASKVTTQSLLLAAQIAGAPVATGSLSGPEDKSAGLAATGDEVISIETKLAEREAIIQAWQSAVRDVAQAVLSEENSIRKGALTDRAATGKAIGAVYDAYKDTLKLGNLN